jgi:2,4-dienoyl-CoA reductase-like NADH-dependent reductase (Old Yellow Enzyme family)/thioredoxin reductase
MYERLFEPFKIGPVVVPNRIVMPPMVVGYAGPRGEVTEQLLAYYEARARGGAGLVIVEASYIREDGKLVYGQLGIYSDELIPGLARLADVIKAHGSAAAIQIVHGGIQAKAPQPVGPSAIARRMIPPAKTPRELTTEEVEQLVEDFAKAALRAKNAGFDSVEVHGTHGYLITQFLSPLTNRRTDKYGADRALFAIEVVQRIKELCGGSFPVIFRLNANEFIEGGITVEYARQVARRLEEAGVDAFDVTGGNYDTVDMLLMPYFYSAEEGWFFKLAKEIKSTVGVPVISGGLVTTPEVALKAIESGWVDAVFVGRQLIADPEWPRKVREGRLRDVRPCLACNEGCVGNRLFMGRPTWCTVNPLAGFEYRWPSEGSLPRSATRKRVAVVGAGPAGLECARIAAIRGHEVTVIEEDSELGGTAVLASIPKFLSGDKRRIARLIDWYKYQLEQLGVKVVLGRKADAKLLEELRPDVVVIATGSRPLIPKIAGVENAVLADDVLVGRVSVGGRVVVVGGGFVGIETALHLAAQGKEVTVVEALPEVARDVEPVSKIALLRPGGLLETHKVKVVTSATVVEIRRNGVEVVIPPLERRLIEADTVVLAVGRVANLDPELVEAAKKIAKEVYIIGDAKAARKIIDAIHEGFFTGLRV